MLSNSFRPPNQALSPTASYYTVFLFLISSPLQVCQCLFLVLLLYYSPYFDLSLLDLGGIKRGEKTAQPATVKIEYCCFKEEKGVLSMLHSSIGCDNPLVKPLFTKAALGLCLERWIVQMYMILFPQYYNLLYWDLLIWESSDILVPPTSKVRDMVVVRWDMWLM